MDRMQPRAEGEGFAGEMSRGPDFSLQGGSENKASIRCVLIASQDINRSAQLRGSLRH